MAMKIYRVTSDHESYALLPSDMNRIRRQKLFQIERMKDLWGDSMPFYVRDPVRTREMDFYNVHLGALAFSEKVFQSDLGEIIERSGEILPAKIDDKDEEILVLNTLACYNCLDRSNSKFRTTPDGSVVIQIFEYSFHPGRIGDQNLFKIPETKNTCIYAVQGRDEPMDEFYHHYMIGGYTGLKFEEIWSV